jgi:hypothetical protein
MYVIKTRFTQTVDDKTHIPWGCVISSTGLQGSASSPDCILYNNLILLITYLRQFSE